MIGLTIVIMLAALLIHNDLANIEEELERCNSINRNRIGNSYESILDTYSPYSRVYGPPEVQEK